MKKIFKLLSLSIMPSLLLVACTKTPSSSSVSSSSSITSSSSTSTSASNSSTFSSSSSSSKEEPKHNLVVYAVNDVHGRIEDDAGSKIAGLAKIREAIYADPDYDPEYSLILSAGDMFQGSGLSNLTLGIAMTEVMNTFPFDAMAIGNHEFDWGLNELLQNIKDEKNYDILSTNIIEKSTNKLPDTVLPSAIYDKGEYKVGVVGSIMSGIDSSIAYNKLKDFEIRYDEELVIAEAQKLKNDGADYVIFLTHQGISGAVENVAMSGYIDLAILGHTHSYVDTSVTVEGRTIPLVQALCNGEAYSKTVFTPKQYLRHEVHQFSTYEINNITLSSEMSTLIAKLNEDIKPILEEPIVKVDGPLTRYSNSNAGNLGMLITKTLYDYGVSVGLENVYAVHNTGGVRANFTADSFPTYMTYGDLYEISPFDNEVKTVSILGRDLRSALSSHYQYPRYDVSTLDINATYNIITIDYLTTNPAYPLYAENGGEYPGGNNYFIRDLLKQEWGKMGEIHIADYPF